MARTGGHVLVTGGSSGIGKATAQAFHRRGARVTLLARGADALDRAAVDIAGPDRDRVHTVRADVTVAREVNAAVSAATAVLGPPDVLVCSAGRARPGYVDELPDDVFEDLMRVNFLGSVHAVRAVLPAMRERGHGHVVLVASAAALVGLFGYTAYGPSKFAVRGFAESLRAELAGSGVGVSVVYLPDVDTPQLAQENRTKPLELAAVAGAAAVWSAADAAELIVRGVRRRRFVVAGGPAVRFLAAGHSVLGPLLRAHLDRVARRARR